MRRGKMRKNEEKRGAPTRLKHAQKRLLGGQQKDALNLPSIPQERRRTLEHPNPLGRHGSRRFPLPYCQGAGVPCFVRDYTASRW